MFLVGPYTNCNGMLSLREQYHHIQTENQLSSFFDALDAVDCEDKTPYLASAIMRKAEFTNWPFKKLSYFKEGKDLLEDFISTHPNHIEARYVRVLTQRNVPGLLNYSDNINEDLEFINAHIDSSDLPDDYKQVMLKNITENTK